MPTITQLASSRERLMRLAKRVSRNTSTSNAIAQIRGSSAPAGGTSPWTRAYMPWPAAAAQPPAMKAKMMMNTDSGAHSR